MNRHPIRTAVVTALFACAPLTASQAQVADKPSATGALDEIVVTATRREERLQDVPISVSAFSQEKIDAQGLRSIDDLSRLSPGVAFSRNGSGSSANYNDENSDISIRGIDSTAGTSTTGIYVDDTPIQTRHIGFGSVNAFPALFDLDRVEVLRGPQGTLFGAGAEGGVVRFITPEPSLTTETGYVRTEYATTKSGDPSYEAGAAAGVPLIDGVLGLRISASFREDGGWVNRANYTLTPDPSNALTPSASLGQVTDAGANYSQTFTFRAALKWQVNDNLSISPSVYHQRLYINDTASYWPNLSDPGSTAYYNGNALTNPSTDPFTLLAVKANWRVGNVDVTSNTSYFTRDQVGTSDYTQYLRATYLSLVAGIGSTYPQLGDAGYAQFGDSQRNFYEELRFASTDKDAAFVWNAGLFFSRLSENVTEYIYDATLDSEVRQGLGAIDGTCLFTNVACTNGLLYYQPNQTVIDKQTALFGEATLRLSNTLKATLGLRVAKLTVDGTIEDGGAFIGAQSVSGASHSSESPVTPKLVLTWQPDRDNMAYLSVAKGYRAGGVNASVGNVCAPTLNGLGIDAAPTTFRSDSLWSYELGSKNSFLDHRLQVDASIYVINWSDIQQFIYLSSCGEGFVYNLGKVRSTGGDITVSYKPISDLTLEASVAYTDAKFLDTYCVGTLNYYPGNGCSTSANVAAQAAPAVSAGDHLPGAPWTINTAGEYRFAEWRGSTPYLRIDYQLQTAQNSLLQTQDPNNAAVADPSLPGLPLNRNLSLRAGFRIRGFDVSLFGNNLTNAHPLLFESRDIFNLPGQTVYDSQYFARSVRPMTIGVTGTYRY